MSVKTIRDVQQYWDEYPVNINLEPDAGSREFFIRYKTKYREVYTDYAHSKELLNFQSYKGKSVLEIGCGMGIEAGEFARHGAHVVAIDLSPKTVELAKQYFAFNNLHGTIEVGNAEQLRFPDNTFDLVVSIGVLYYTPDTQKAIDEIGRVLKRAGKAVCLFYNRYSWLALLARISGTNVNCPTKDPPIIHLYSATEVKKMFRGFNHIEVLFDRFPTKTLMDRKGTLAQLYNRGLVPLFNVIPKGMIKPFGFHIIINAVK
jgi:ubiquinone/menaquinone biosynthesis C-methylase UbiE